MNNIDTIPLKCKGVLYISDTNHSTQRDSNEEKRGF